MANPTILQLAADLAAGRTTSRKLTEEAFARIEDAKGEGKRVFVRTWKSQAMAAACRARTCAPAWAFFADSPRFSIAASLSFGIARLTSSISAGNVASASAAMATSTAWKRWKSW